VKPPCSIPSGGASRPGIPPATQQPTGLGDDQELNQFAQECYDGDMASCDALYLIADQGTPYETYGVTCAGRQAEDASSLCEESFPS